MGGCINTVHLENGLGEIKADRDDGLRGYRHQLQRNGKYRCAPQRSSRRFRSIRRPYETRAGRKRTVDFPESPLARDDDGLSRAGICRRRFIDIPFDLCAA